jgi:hypothetical protein
VARPFFAAEDEERARPDAALPNQAGESDDAAARDG